MNVLDILLLLAAVWFAIVGFRQGFVVGILSVTGFLGGGLVAVYLLPVIWDALTDNAEVSTTAAVVAVLHAGPGEAAGIAVALLAESAARARVEGPNQAAHHVQPERLEAVFEQEMLGLGAVPGVAVGRADDLRFSLGRAVDPIDEGQTVRADHRVPIQRHDREAGPGRGHGAGILAIPVPVDNRAADAAARLEGRLRLPHGPAGDLLGVRLLHRPQVDTITDDHGVRWRIGLTSLVVTFGRAAHVPLGLALDRLGRRAEAGQPGRVERLPALEITSTAIRADERFPQPIRTDHARPVGRLLDLAVVSGHLGPDGQLITLVDGPRHDEPDDLGHDRRDTIWSPGRRHVRMNAGRAAVAATDLDRSHRDAVGAAAGDQPLRAR